MKIYCSLYLVRHGESIANSEHVVGGHVDSELTENGRQQAEEVKSALAAVHFDAAYSSDLKRASETTEIIFGKPIPKSHLLFDLRERYFGHLEGGPMDVWNGINAAYEKQYGSIPYKERLEHEFADYIEGDKALIKRFTGAIKQIARDNPGKTVLVGTHGGPIRVILMYMGFASLMTAGSFKNGGYVEILCDGDEMKLGKVVGVDRDRLTAE